MKSKIGVYVRSDGELNPATSVYVDFIIKNSGSNFVGVFNDVNKLSECDTVLTVYSGNAIRCWIFKLKMKKQLEIYNWYQGVASEELKLMSPSFKNSIKGFVWSLTDFISLRVVSGAFFVSKYQLKHYKEKYYKKEVKSLVMPCFNALNSNENRNFEKTGNSFVYAGGMQAWQCIVETLKVHKALQLKVGRDLPLYLYTGDLEVAKDLVGEVGVQNCKVCFVQPNLLQDELSKHSYAYMLRKESVVNLVCTPTKLNSYLAAGLKVITTNSIGFIRETKNNALIKLNMESSPDENSAVIESTLNLGLDDEVCYNLNDEIYNFEKFQSEIKGFLL